MRLSSARRAWERWQACAGPWAGWSVCPTLLSPELEAVTPQSVRSPLAPALARELAASLQAGGVLLVLDLEPVLGVRIAALLNEWRVAHGVLVLPRWPYARAVLPVDGLLHALVEQSHRLNHDRSLPNVAFVLDGERTCTVRNRSTSDERADNRYRLGPADLPSLASLRARDIHEVRKVGTT